MLIPTLKPARGLAATGLTLGLILGALLQSANAGPVAAGPTTSPVCAPPCVEDARVRPKANVHDPDRERVRAAEPVVRESSGPRTVAPAEPAKPEQNAPIDHREQQRGD